MKSAWWAFGVWAAVAASALFWGLRLFVVPAPAPAHTTVVATAAPLRGDLTRLFGVDAPPEVEEAPNESTRFQLLGVVAPRSPAAVREGLALISVDGRPPRTYRVGAVVDGQNVLQDVRGRTATLGPRDGAARVSLEIPPPAMAATGTLPPAIAPVQPLRNLLPVRPSPAGPYGARPAPGAVVPQPNEPNDTATE